jgi:hypothetical protein
MPEVLFLCTFSKVKRLYLIFLINKQKRLHCGNIAILSWGG